MKVALSEIKKNLQGTNSGGEDEAEIQTKIYNIRKIKALSQNSKKKKIIQKKEDSLRSLCDISRRINIQIMGMPEEGEEQEVENLFEKIMKENFPNLVKETDVQDQEAQSPKQIGPKEDHTKTNHN